MARNQSRVSQKAHLPFKSANKERRHSLYASHRKARESSRRDDRLRRRREEDRIPRLRAERLRRNVPLTLERKRVWDQVDNDTTDGLGLSIDVERMQQQLQDSEQAKAEEESHEEENGDLESDLDSMIDSASDVSNEENTTPMASRLPQSKSATARASSPTRSTTSTNLNCIPDALAIKFPSLFVVQPNLPKILVTTSIRSTLHKEAHILTTLFPNSIYIPRSSHRYSHNYSIKEISSFAANRKYTAVIILNEDQKKPKGLDIVHLPAGPMFHFTITSWIESKKLPGHGVATNHYAELNLQNFRTSLGLSCAHLFRQLFPSRPEFAGRQVVTFHNQRDFIFVRHHRYVFRDKRATEKALVGTDGKEVKGMEDIRTGLQELGPRFTLKLRRIDKGIQRSSGQEWEWKGKTDRIRTKFQL